MSTEQPPSTPPIDPTTHHETHAQAVERKDTPPSGRSMLTGVRLNRRQALAGSAIAIAALVGGMVIGSNLGASSNAANGGTYAQYGAAADSEIASLRAQLASQSGSPSPSPSPTDTSPSPSSSPSPTATSPSSGTLTGTSLPGIGAFPTAKAVRIYWSGLPQSSLPSTPAGAALFISFKQLPSDAAFIADMASWASTGRQIYFTFYHEGDGGGISPSAFQSGWASLLADEAAHPYSNVHSLTILMAYCFQRGNCEAYYVPKVDVIGFDCYQLSNQPITEAYALAKGKRMVFGEVGNVTSGGNTDAAALTYAKQFWAGLSSNVLASIWWSGPSDSLAGKPMTTAFLASQP